MGTKRRKSGSKGKGEKSSSSHHVEKPSHPDDIFPLVLTSATQELFGCRADEDVTGECPYKLLKKDNIIQDIKTRAAVSDFNPVKQILLDYPEEEVLLVFDRDFTYDYSFYLVLTPEAKHRILNPPVNEVNETPKPKQWISLGSEREIDEESVKETQEKLCFKGSRVRRKFGARVSFTDRSAAEAKDGCLGCASYQDSRFSIKLMQRDCGVQAVPRLQISSTQTQCGVKRNFCTQYVPREFTDEEKENILQSESLENFCKSVTPRMLRALQQGEIMGVSSDEALDTPPEDADKPGKFSGHLNVRQTFSNQKYTKDKKISCISWHPTIYGVIAVALSKKTGVQLTQTKTSVIPPLILFYSFANYSNPLLLLECLGDILAFEFCPSDPNIIVGGCTNGQVVLWDISAHAALLQGTQPGGKKASVNTDTFDLNDKKENKTPTVRYCAVSALESSHKMAITDVQWLPPTFQVTKSGVPVENKDHISYQLITCSPDCAILFWDLRVSKLPAVPTTYRNQDVDQKPPMTRFGIPDTFKHLNFTWKPLFKVCLPKIDTIGEYAPLKFSLEPYTCNGNNTDEGNQRGSSSEFTSDDIQLGAAPAKPLAALEGVNTKLYVGTEDREIVYTDWKLVKDEAGRRQIADPLHCFRIHDWYVTTVQHSPIFKDIILTTGGWQFAIWKEGVMDGPIILSPSSEQLYTAGCWSLSRPAVFFIGKEDGSIEVWNLLSKSSTPMQFRSSFNEGKITCIKPWTASPKQHSLAVADDNGVVRVIDIPKALYVPSENERQSVLEYFELKTKRLKDSLRRQEEWVKEAEALKKNTEPEKPVSSLQDEEAAMEKNYRDYMKLEESILKGKGL